MFLFSHWKAWHVQCAQFEELEALFLENLGVILEAFWRKSGSAFQKSPPKVQSNHFLAGVHVSVWGSKGWVPLEDGELFQPVFSLCWGSLKGFMEAHMRAHHSHKIVMYGFVWVLQCLRKYVPSVCQGCSKFVGHVFCSFCGLGLLSRHVAVCKSCISFFLPLLLSLMSRHIHARAHTTVEKSVGNNLTGLANMLSTPFEAKLA